MERQKVKRWVERYHNFSHRCLQRPDSREPCIRNLGQHETSLCDLLCHRNRHYCSVHCAAVGNKREVLSRNENEVSMVELGKDLDPVVESGVLGLPNRQKILDLLSHTVLLQVEKNLVLCLLLFIPTRCDLGNQHFELRWQKPRRSM